MEGWATYFYSPETEEENQSKAINEALSKLAQDIVRRTVEGWY